MKSLFLTTNILEKLLDFNIQTKNYYPDFPDYYKNMVLVRTKSN